MAPGVAGAGRNPYPNPTNPARPLVLAPMGEAARRGARRSVGGAALRMSLTGVAPCPGPGAGNAGQLLL